MRPLRSTLSYLVPFWAVLLARAAFALPGGCGGTLGTVSFKSTRLPNGIKWTCSNVNPSSVPGSGNNALLSHSTQSDTPKCAKYCSNSWPQSSLNAAFWYPSTSTCQCWSIGLFSDNLKIAKDKTHNITFIDFFAYPPSAPVKFGVFTCPAGSHSANMWTYGSCTSLSVTPASAPIYKGASGLIICENLGAEYAIQNKNGIFDCYKGLAKAKYHYQYLSQYTLYDLLDFKSHK